MEVPRSPGRILQPLQSLLRHWRLGVLAALLVLVVGIPFAAVKGRSAWSAEAVFQVAPYFQKNVSVDREMELQSNSQYREFVNHLSRSLLRYDVVREALRRVRAAGTDPCPPARSERLCVERLQRTLRVLPVADTYMVRVELSSADREQPHKVVNALMDVFLEVTQEEQVYGSDERAQMIAGRSRQLRQELADLGAKRDEKAARLGLTTFGENTTNAYDLVLAQARERAVRATADRSQAQALLDAFLAHREVPIVAGRSVLEMRLQDNGLQALRNEVVKRTEELGRSVQGLEDRHPGKAPALKERDEIAGRLVQRESEFDRDARANVHARLKAGLQQARQVEREAVQAMKDLEGRAAEFAAGFREAVRLTAEMKKREQELNELRDRTNFLQSERKAIGFVRLVTPALPPEVPQGFGRIRLALLVLLAALACALVLPVLADFVDPRVLVPADAERAMQVPAAGWVVAREDSASDMLAEDQARRLASMLLRQKRQGGRQVFGFTSARVGGGTTTLVSELARTLQVLGSRVLVVEANTLSAGDPGEPVVADAHARPTLADLLAGRATARELVAEPGNGELTAGRVPGGALAADGLQRLDLLKAALDEWAEAWDLVLVDAPPLLPSADAELLVESLGQVFVVVEAGSVPKSDVALVRSALRRLDPAGVGLIVTRVNPARLGPAWLRQSVERVTGRRFDAFAGSSLLGLRLSGWLARLRFPR